MSRSRRPYLSFASTTMLRPFGCLVRERRELRRVGELFGRDAVGGQERGRLPVAERDRAGLVEQQHVDVAGRSTARPTSR
jgi:hypothetical protein